MSSADKLTRVKNGIKLNRASRVSIIEFGLIKSTREERTSNKLLADRSYSPELPAEGNSASRENGSKKYRRSNAKQSTSCDRFSIREKRTRFRAVLGKFNARQGFTDIGVHGARGNKLWDNSWRFQIFKFINLASG